MNLLLIEDDPNKLRQLSDLIHESCSDVSLVERRSYQSGLQEALKGGVDLIVLDMSIPTYDISPLERGGRFRPFGGRELLHRLSRRGVSAKAIVVTQFDRFGEGSDVMTLDELRATMRAEFPGYYVDTIFYQPGSSEWRERLREALRVAVL